MAILENIGGIDFLKTVSDNSVDLVITDPPYITSTETGMGNLFKQIKENKEKGVEFVKTDEDWNSVKDKYKDITGMTEEKMKDNYKRFGSIYGSKYSVQTEYGDWDTEFTMEILDEFIGDYYKKLRKGGTLIIFFDIWKITPLKEIMEKYKFIKSCFQTLKFIYLSLTNPHFKN